MVRGMLIAVLLIQPAVARPSVLRAQQADREGRIRGALADTAARFRLRGTTIGTVEGRLVRLDDLTVTLSEHAPVALAGLDTVWRRGRATVTGGIVGSVLLGIPGAVLGSFAAGLCDTSSCPSQLEGITVGAVFGAATGFLVGALIGTFIPKWHRSS